MPFLTMNNFNNAHICEAMRISLTSKVCAKTRTYPRLGANIGGRAVISLACAGAFVTSLALRTASTVEPLFEILGDAALAIKGLKVRRLVGALVVRPFIQFPILIVLQLLGTIYDCAYKGSGIAVGLISPRTAHRNLRNDFKVYQLDIPF